MSPQATREPLEKEHPYRLIFETARVCAYRANEEAVITEIGPGIETISGYSDRHFEGKQLTRLFYPEDADQVVHMGKKAVLGEAAQIEIRLRTSNDDPLWTLTSFAPQRPEKRPKGFGGLLIDVQRFKETQLALKAQKEKYRDILEGFGEGYFETDLNGRITFCNKALLDMVGYADNELIGKRYCDVTPPRTAHAMQTVFRRVYKSGKNARAINYEVFHKDGRTLTIEFTAALTLGQDSQPSGFSGTIRDISAQVKASQNHKIFQARLCQAQKMEALGTLAGGLAHGFNNVLMAIQGNLSLMRMHLPKDHHLQKHLERINQSTDKGVTLAKQILSFAKMGKFVVMTTNINKLLKSTSRLFARTQSTIRIHEFYERDLWETQVDRVQIGQLLLSMYTNAAEAMPEGGDLHLQSENVVLDETYTRAYDVEPGRFVKISITDSGIGLDEDAKQRIFEPFFSAYRPKRYNGLGLAAVYGTIKSHQGIISVYSEKGHGATFTIYLPALRGGQSAPDARLSPAGGGETILLADNDENAASAGRDILEQCGYRVIVAGGGAEAIEIYRDHGGRIDLVLLDIIMPDIDGKRVFQDIKKINPDARVIVTSGYGVNRKISHLLRLGCMEYVQKPFHKNSLATKVRAALDKKTNRVQKSNS